MHNDTINHKFWVIVANSNICRIYQYNKKPPEFNLLKEIDHPENKLRDIDLTSDKPGRYKSSGSRHGAYVQATDPKAVKIENFSREIACELESGRGRQAYTNLIVIAPPHMYGLLSQHLNKHVKNLISHNIEKDVIHLPEHELLNFMRSHI